MRTSKECRATRREIDEAQADRRMAEPALEHLSSCASCREFHNQHLQLSQLLGSLQPVTAPADFDVRLRARLMRQSSDRRNWFKFPGFAFGTPAVAVAAAVVVLVGGVVLLNQTGVIPKGSAPRRAVSQPAPPGNANPVPAATIAGNQPAKVGDGAQDNPSTSNKNQPLSAAASRQRRDSNVQAKRNEVRSDDLAVKPAPLITRNESEQNGAEISLSKPFEFSLQDSQGVTRKFSLPPVSFGSQQLVRRGQPSQSASNRIW
jgi:hypothetical protein